MPHSLDNIWYVLESQGLETQKSASQCSYKRKKSAATITIKSSSTFCLSYYPESANLIPDTKCCDERS